jgi:hypothetical protein
MTAPLQLSISNYQLAMMASFAALIVAKATGFWLSLKIANCKLLIGATERSDS